MVWNSFKRIFRQNIVYFIILIITIIVIVIVNLIPAQLQKKVVDEYLSLGISSGLLELGIYFLIVTIMIGIFDFIKQFLLVILGEKFTKEIRYEMSTKLKRINTRYFSENEVGVITSRFTNDVESINKLFTQGAIGMFIDLFMILGIIVSMFIFDITLGLLTLVAIPIVFYITRLIQKQMLKAQIRHKQIVGTLNNHISETLNNEKMIRIYSSEKYMEDKYGKYLSKNYTTVESINFYDSIFPPIILLAKSLLIITIVILASDSLTFLPISVGAVAGAIELATSLFKPIESLGMELQSIQSSMAGIARVNEFDHELDEEKKLNITASDVINNREKLSIKFDHVSFSYDSEVIVLNDITLDILSKEKVTIIGRTGVGKTTLFKLVMGLLKPTQGEITINGINVYDIPNEIKHEIFGYVDQQFAFIKGNVKDQISLKNDYSDEKVDEVLEFVGLNQYIQSLPQGLYTPCSPNLFSQGEKQLLSIARSIITNPPILLLDEMTANLDSLTEKKIISVLENASLSRTVLSISHRLASIDNSDKVVYIENGVVKMVGTKNEIFSQESFQKELLLEKLWR